MRMMSSFSEAGYLNLRRPHPRSCFFEQAVLKGQIGNALIQGTRFTAQVLQIATGRCTRSVASKPALASFHELLGSGVIKVLRNAFLAAQLGNVVLPRRTSSTILILSSAEKCRRVARRISFTTRLAEAFGWPECFGLILVPASLR